MQQFDTYPLAELPEYRISALEQAGPALVLAGAVAALSLGHGVYRRRPFFMVLSAVFASLAGALLWIYRNPERQPPQGQNLVLAPCDGRVLAVTNVAGDHYVEQPAYLLQIAISAADVQVSRAPIGGTVSLRRYEAPSPAGRAGMSDSNWLGIEQAGRVRVLVRQVANPFWRMVPWQSARRIICWPDLGDTVTAGQMIGHLPLGGRAELYIPATYRVKVRAGQTIRAGETIIAEI